MDKLLFQILTFVRSFYFLNHEFWIEASLPLFYGGPKPWLLFLLSYPVHGSTFLRLAHASRAVMFCFVFLNSLTIQGFCFVLLSFSPGYFCYFLGSTTMHLNACLLYFTCHFYVFIASAFQNIHFKSLLKEEVCLVYPQNIQFHMTNILFKNHFCLLTHGTTRNSKYAIFFHYTCTFLK